jgi:putative ATP-binding cassette transporter
MRFLFIFFSSLLFRVALAQEEPVMAKIDALVQAGMEAGDIPGISLVIIAQDKQTILNYGLADTELGIPVTNKTLFEIGANGHAFTALAILRLADAGEISLDNPLNQYLTDVEVILDGKLTEITLRQLMHHISGIPWNANHSVSTISLNGAPGSRYEFSELNYVLLNQVIEQISGTTYTRYLEVEIMAELGMDQTTFSPSEDASTYAQGHKISFFKARPYQVQDTQGKHPPMLRSNIEDLSLWLKHQIGISDHPFNSLIDLSHQRNKKVRPIDLSSYAFGWNVSLTGNELIYHHSTSTNFTTYLGFNKEKRFGIALLANSNSASTAVLGGNIMSLLLGEEVRSDVNPGDSLDTRFSVATIMIGLYLLVVLAFLGLVGYRWIKGKRQFQPLSRKKALGLAGMVLTMGPYFYGIWLIPRALTGLSWEVVLTVAPQSFYVMIVLSVAAMLLSYLAHVISTLFPESNSYYKDAPIIILFSILSGLANVVVILLITSSLDNPMELKYQLFYLGLTIMVYLLGVKVVRTKMTYLTRNIVYDMRIRMIKLVFSTSFEKFEKIDSGRIYTTLSADINTLGQSANTIVTIITSVITILGSFVYMATLSFWSTMVTLFIVLSLSSIYYLVSRGTEYLYDETRETSTVFMRLLNEMIHGFKELSIHLNKKLQFREEMEVTVDEYRVKSTRANLRFIYAFLFGESLMLFTLATVAFAIGRIFPEIESYTIISFIIILLYLIGPLNIIFSCIPQILQLKIANNKIQRFIKDVPANLELGDMIREIANKQESVGSFAARALSYDYNLPESNFSVGPVDLEVHHGEVVFIIGGNGSGKTTLAKLLTGLYSPDSGNLMIDGKPVASTEIGEYFSVVFSPSHLFQRIYNVDVSQKSEEIDQYMNLFQLDGKLTIEDNSYSTIKLSAGQRKRLALLQCFLEDKPILLFDEWAADQDPVFRKIFYRELIPAMKRQGKIIIAITHDEQYFDAADRIYRMESGQMRPYHHSERVVV